MEPKDLPSLFNEFKLLEQKLGIYTAVTIVVVGLILIGIWRFLIKKIEKAAEAATDRSLKKFQAQLDQANHRFEVQHTKQIDAIETLYKAFISLSTVLKFTINGEKFTQVESAHKQLLLLVEFRHGFKNTFQQNRLRLRVDLCNKIELILPIIDEYIEVFQSGIMPGQEEIQEDEEQDNGLVISAIWPAGLLESNIVRIEQVAKEIETDFRTAYGTE